MSSSSGTHAIEVPQMGDSITEGQVVEITKKVGDFVKIDEVVAILETDKVSVDITSQASGRVTAINVKSGDTVEVGQGVMTIDTSAKPDASSSKEEPKAAPSASTSPPARPKSDGQSTSFIPSAPAAAPVGNTSQAEEYHPSIEFKYGKRDAPLKKEAPKSGAPKASVAKGPALDELPERYRKSQRLSEAEIESVNSGVALFTLYGPPQVAAPRAKEAKKERQ